LLIADVGKSTVEVYLNSRLLGRAEFTQSGVGNASFPVPEGAAGNVEIEFRVSPPYRPRNDPRLLGIAILSFGFR